MTKISSTNTLTYIYDADRKGAKYSLNNGESYMNHGDYAECLAKAVLGFDPVKDANTRFDKGEDIPELNASVKSWNCGLTDTKLGHNREEFLENFWARSTAETYIWVNDYADVVDLYMMNPDEFKQFVDHIASWDNHCEKIRFKTCIAKTVAYLEAQL